MNFFIGSLKTYFRCILQNIVAASEFIKYNTNMFCLNVRKLYVYRVFVFPGPRPWPQAPTCIYRPCLIGTENNKSQRLHIMLLSIGVREVLCKERCSWTPFLTEHFCWLLLNILLNSRESKLIIKNETPAQALSCDFCEIVRLHAVLPYNCLCSFPFANLQEGELYQIYTNTYSSFWKHLEFSQ